MEVKRGSGNVTFYFYSTSNSMESEVPMADQLLPLFNMILCSVVCQLVDVLGCAANIINIACFVRQGLKDSVNISLLGLSISDLGCLATLIFSNICMIPELEELILPFEPFQVQYLVTAWPHVIFTRVTSWVTAFIALERCLCVAFPLKVSKFITPKRTSIIIVSLFIVLFSCGSPMYIACGLGWRFSSLRNRTVLTLVYSSDREFYETIAFTLNNVVISFGAFAVIFVCTTILFISLRNKSKWRQTSTVGEQARALSNRDQRVTKLVVVISVMFVACFVPICLAFLGMMLVPGLTLDGEKRHWLFLVAGFAILLESTNSALNIFFYYHMSSNYRATFRQLFHLRPLDKK